MKFRVLPVVCLAFVLAVSCRGQESAPMPAGGQQSGAGAGGDQRSGRGGFGGMMGGNGVSGTVTEVAADHYSVKTDAGEAYTIRFSSNTRIVKQTAGMGGPGMGQGQPSGQGSGPNQGPGAGPGQAPGQGSGPGQGEGQGPGAGQGQGRGERGNSAQQLKASDIKVGDSVMARGDVDAKAKTVNAQFIVQIDPQRMAQQRQQQTDFGKTWLAGKVTAIDGVKITLSGSVDNAPHVFVADENTTFRRRHEPVILADIQNGDMVRVEGAVKDGVFTAATVTLMATPQTTTTLPGTSAPPDGSGAASPNGSAPSGPAPQ